jgi:hypothetical protein
LSTGSSSHPGVHAASYGNKLITICSIKWFRTTLLAMAWRWLVAEGLPVTNSVHDRAPLPEPGYTGLSSSAAFHMLTTQHGRYGTTP